MIKEPNTLPSIAEHIPGPWQERARTPLHLDFLDGLRGAAALYVVLYHIAKFPGMTPGLQMLTAWMGYGQLAVVVFIVLSGYCLMLPVTRSEDGRLRGGLREYWVRRSRRILPAYYVALLLSCGMIVVSLTLKEKVGQTDTYGWGVLAPGNLLTHALLLHNLWLDYVQSIDPPMWSVATEWQIYFVFAFALLPLWRKAGILMTLVAAFALGLLPHLLLPAGNNFDWACPWFIGLFAMGMAGAEVGFSPRPQYEPWRKRVPWGVFSLVFFGLTLACLAQPLVGQMGKGWLLDTFAGTVALTLIIDCARKTGTGSPFLRLFSARPLTWLGKISYSLYLIHFPVWWFMQHFIRKLHPSPIMEFLIRVGIGIPCILLLAYGFYLLFERPFMARSVKRTRSIPVPST